MFRSPAIVSCEVFLMLSPSKSKGVVPNAAQFIDEGWLSLVLWERAAAKVTMDVAPTGGGDISYNLIMENE